jgi:hypothetical protein
MTTKAIATNEHSPDTVIPSSTAITPMDMLARAVERGIDGDQLSKLMDLQQRWESDQARKAYVAAMTAFKAEPLRVTKGKHVAFGNTKYDHATLAQVVDAVVSSLSKHGLSHRWDTAQNGETITVSCVITHIAGHSERTTLSAEPDQSGGKNKIQAVGSTVSYLQRYTLMAATGLAAHDMDDDAATGEVATLSEDQIANLDALMDEVKADREKFLKWARAEKLADIPAKSYETCVKMLEKKR